MGSRKTIMGSRKSYLSKTNQESRIRNQESTRGNIFLIKSLVHICTYILKNE